MEYVQLGRTGLEIPRLILGCAGFGDVTDADRARRLVHAALDRGVNAFDTSNAYNAGLSESLLGSALGPRRDRAVILTKLGFRTEAAYDEMAAILRTGRLRPEELATYGITPSDFGMSRRNIRRSVDASLRRLGTDYIDVLQLHYWDPRTPADEILETLDDLLRLGKVCYLGCSSVSSAQLTTLLAAGPRSSTRIQAVQVALNLLTPFREPSFPELATRSRVSVLAFGALAAGFFGEQFDPSVVPDRSSRFGSRKGNIERYWNCECLDYARRLGALAQRTGRSIVELAQGFVSAMPSVAAILAGANDEGQLDERIRALEAPLSEEELALLAAL